MRVNIIKGLSSLSMTGKYSQTKQIGNGSKNNRRPFLEKGMDGLYITNPYAFSNIIHAQNEPNRAISVIKNQDPNQAGYFDLKALSKIKTKQTVEEKPLPFEKSHGLFSLDNYQKEAIDSFKEGNTTLVSAPTGTGKTLIAEYAIKDTLEKGKKLIYLSPLKALSNEKFTEFAKLFGTYDEEGNLVNTANVGLMTGDKTINPNAPVMVMTTEIYRNSLLVGDDDTIDADYTDYDAVIYDEFHYLGDPDRGTVWEEAVMNTPNHMKQMMLSATASNAPTIENWLKSINPSIKTHLVNVPESERHVPLREFVLMNNDKNQFELVNMKKQKIDIYRLQNRINLSQRQVEALSNMAVDLGFNSEDETIGYIKSLAGKQSHITTEYLSKNLENMGVDKEKAESYSLILANKGSTTYDKNLTSYSIIGGRVKSSEIVKLLDSKKMTPALIYIFSKKGCDLELEMASQFSESLLTPEESKMVYDEVQACKEQGIFLGSDFDDKALEALMKGFASHHAGKLPAYKSLVEKLARKGLIKVCFATETLIAGINMPFKTTVFSSLTKYSDTEGEAYISNSTFKQGAGRAGRRNKDIIGNVIVIPHTIDDYEKYVELSKSTDTSILSQYNPSYASCLSDKTLNNIEETALRTLGAEESPANMEHCLDLMNAKTKLLKLFEYVIEGEDGKLYRTEKGELAKKVFGVNELFMTELLLEPKYFKDFTSTELIAIASSIADVKDENPNTEFNHPLKYLNHSANQITGLIDEIAEFENYEGISSNKIKFSTNLAPYIVHFADEVPSDEKGAIDGWCAIMQKLRSKELIYHNGDFLRVINNTIDILKLISELSPDKNICDEANIAIEKLRKPPVMDVLNYELSPHT